MLNSWFKQQRSATPVQPAYRHGNQHFIELQQVVKTYKTEAGTFTALKGINLTVYRGEFDAILGKSGRGTSTLLNVLTGIHRPTTVMVLLGEFALHPLVQYRMDGCRPRGLR